MDQVVVLLIWLPPSTPNPWSAQIRPNSASINPSANVTTKVLLIQGSYARFGQLLAKTWTAGPPHTDRISRFVADNLPGAQMERTPVESMVGIRSVPDFAHRAVTHRHIASPVGGLPVGVAHAVVPDHMSRRNLYIDTRDRGSASSRQRLPWAPLKWALRLRVCLGDACGQPGNCHRDGARHPERRPR